MHNYQIEIFIAVVEYGSFTQAAKHLFISATAVMKQINLLEERLNLQLINRSSKGISLTDAGRSFYKDAKELMNFSKKAIDRAKVLSDESSQIIRVGTSFLNPISFFMPIWNQVIHEYPYFKLHIVPFDDNRVTILDTIKNLGLNIDFIFGVCSSVEWLKYCNLIKIGTFKLCCAIPAEHHLSDKNIIKFKDLHGESLMLPMSGDAPVNDKLKSFIIENHPEINIIDIPNYYDLDVFNTCQQMGNILLTLDIWSDIHPMLLTKPLDWKESWLPYGLMYGNTINESSKEFLRILKEINVI